MVMLRFDGGQTLNPPKVSSSCTPPRTYADWVWPPTADHPQIIFEPLWSICEMIFNQKVDGIRTSKMKTPISSVRVMSGTRLGAVLTDRLAFPMMISPASRIYSKS